MNRKVFVMIVFIALSLFFVAGIQLANERAGAQLAKASMTKYEDNDVIRITTSVYEWTFDKYAGRWNYTRLDFNEDTFKDVRWKLYYNDTSIWYTHAKYNSPNGTRTWTNRTTAYGYQFNITCTSNYDEDEAPDVKMMLYFYEGYFVEDIVVSHTIPDTFLEIEKIHYIDPDVRNFQLGARANVKVVSWRYQQRFNFNDTDGALIGSDAPEFVYSVASNKGVVIAPLNPTWQVQFKLLSYAAYEPWFNGKVEFSDGGATGDYVRISNTSSLAMGEVFYQFTGNDINTAFQGYAECIAQRFSTRPYKSGCNTYWLTWYAQGGDQYGQNVTESMLISNATWIKNNLLPYYGFDTVHLDAIICDEVGDWGNYSSTRFPSGMKNIVDTIHDMGLKVGLWLAPYRIEKDGWINQSHPNSLARNKTGDLIMSTTYYGGVKHEMYYLDPYDPWTKSRIQYINGLVNQWGFDFVKLDFLQSLMGDYYRENKTLYMNMNEMLSTATANISSNVIVLAICGQKDASHPYYNPSTLARYIDRFWVPGKDDLWWDLDNILSKYDVMTTLMPIIKYLNLTLDTDSLGRDPSTNDIPFKMTKYYSTYATVAGGTFELSERMSDINATRLNWMKKFLPYTVGKWDVKEWMGVLSDTLPPRIWLKNVKINGHDRHYVALFNPQNTTQTIKISFSELGLSSVKYQVYDLYAEQIIGEYSKDFTVSLEGETSTILTFALSSDQPLVLARANRFTVEKDTLLSEAFSNQRQNITLIQPTGTKDTLTIFAGTYGQPSYVLNVPFNSTENYNSSTTILTLDVVHDVAEKTFVISWEDFDGNYMVAADKALSSVSWSNQQLTLSSETDTNLQIYVTKKPTCLLYTQYNLTSEYANNVVSFTMKNENVTVRLASLLLGMRYEAISDGTLSAPSQNNALWRLMATVSCTDTKAKVQIFTNGYRPRYVKVDGQYLASSEWSYNRTTKILTFNVTCASERKVEAIFGITDKEIVGMATGSGIITTIVASLKKVKKQSEEKIGKTKTKILIIALSILVILILFWILWVLIDVYVI